MIKFDISNTLETASAQYEFDADTLNEKCLLKLKSTLKIKYGKSLIKKQISNTIELNDEEIIKAFRQAHNDEEINLGVRKKLRSEREKSNSRLDGRSPVNREAGRTGTPHPDWFYGCWGCSRPCS